MREPSSAARSLGKNDWVADRVVRLLNGLLESVRLPGRLRDRRAGPALAALGAVGLLALLGAWWLAARAPARGAFPRSASELTAATLDGRLTAALERLQSDPDDLQGLVEAGTLNFLKGADHYRAAINQLETARRLGALDGRIFFYLGVMYQAEGLVPFAIAEYERFVRNFPDDREARLLLAKLLFQTGRYEDAAVHYQSMRAPRGPTDPVIEENLGLSLLALKRLDEAAKSFEPLLAQPPFEARARFHLGRIAYEQGRYDEAGRHLAVAAAASPERLAGVDLAALWSAHAANAERLLDWEAAKQRWDRVAELEPKNAKAKAASRAAAAKLRAAKKPAPKPARKAQLPPKKR
ncbi:MAG: tetratricopeptide repeat protein [Elusimicrobia bacterium]|nr:tetratricopeptide repeat protein [Elusimicrobiota bacterium]